MNKRILITDRVHPLLVEGLRSFGLSADDAPNMSYNEVKEAVSDYDGLIINSKVVCDETFLASAAHLDFIGRLGSGLDIIDQEAARSKGIAVISSPEGNANAVGEHALGMLLSLLNNISRSHHDLLTYQWVREPHRGQELRGKSIGIIGYGHTGPAFARKLRSMGVNIYVYDKYKALNEREESGVTPVALDRLISSADVVSIHLPLTDETKDMVDISFLLQMKPGSILINTSRGQIVRSSDLLQCLITGQIGGACLDVLENEKPDTWSDAEKEVYTAMLGMKNVLITPHIAGWTEESLHAIASILLSKIQAFYSL